MKRFSSVSYTHLSITDIPQMGEERIGARNDLVQLRITGVNIDILLGKRIIVEPVSYTHLEYSDGASYYPAREQGPIRPMRRLPKIQNHIS